MKNKFINPKHPLLIILVLVLLIGTAKSQESITFHRNYIGLSVTELLFVDFRVNYERKINLTHGIKLEIGYKPAYRYFTDATNIDLGHRPTAWCYRNTATWYYISIGYKYYFNRKKTIYVSPELFYKTLQADKVVYTWGIGAGGSSLENQYELRSMKTSVIGTNLLIGKKMKIIDSDSYSLGFDIFCGFSLRSKIVNTTIFGGTTAYYPHDSPPRQVTIPLSDEPIETIENFIQPSFQFGIILYGSWK